LLCCAGVSQHILSLGCFAAWLFGFWYQTIAMAHSSIVTGLPPTAGNAPERTPKLMSRNDVEALIAEGKRITIFHNQVIKMDAWMPYHPGGDKAMLHLVGKDASDEIDA
jgi:delta8-fatty-acid desaturase